MFVLNRDSPSPNVQHLFMHILQDLSLTVSVARQTTVTPLQTLTGTFHHLSGSEVIRHLWPQLVLWIMKILKKMQIFHWKYSYSHFTCTSRHFSISALTGCVSVQSLHPSEEHLKANYITTLDPSWPHISQDSLRAQKRRKKERKWRHRVP